MEVFRVQPSRTSASRSVNSEISGLMVITRPSLKGFKSSGFQVLGIYGIIRIDKHAGKSVGEFRAENVFRPGRALTLNRGGGVRSVELIAKSLCKRRKLAAEQDAAMAGYGLPRFDIAKMGSAMQTMMAVSVLKCRSCALISQRHCSGPVVRNGAQDGRLIYGRVASSPEPC